MATELFNRLFEDHCQGVLYLSSFFFLNSGCFHQKEHHESRSQQGSEGMPTAF